MTTARAKALKPVSKTGYYHCSCQCIKSTYLTGTNIYTGASFHHRSDWILSRLENLSELFFFSVKAHYIDLHQYDIVLSARPTEARVASDRDIAMRWLMVCPPKKALNKQGQIDTNLRAYQKVITPLLEDADKIQVYRERLTSLSWFMRFLNEYIARKANIEDRQSGSFWASRYKSRVLESEVALQQCITLKPYTLTDESFFEDFRHALFESQSEADNPTSIAI